MEIKGLEYWIDFINQVKEWVSERPDALEKFDWYDVENVAYDDLKAIAEYYEAAHQPEDWKHRQCVEVEFNDDFSLKFFSPARPFTYAPIGD